MLSVLTQRCQGVPHEKMWYNYPAADAIVDELVYKVAAEHTAHPATIATMIGRGMLNSDLAGARLLEEAVGRDQLDRLLGVVQTSGVENYQLALQIAQDNNLHIAAQTIENLIAGATNISVFRWW